MVDQSKVLDAIVNCEVGAGAKQEAGRLIEAYLEKLDSFPDTRIRSLGVEVPWYILLAPQIIAVGVVDRILDDDNMTVCEWKTRRAPKITKAGVPYKGDTEDDWLAEIGGGVQLAVYGLARREGHFLLSDNHPKLGQTGKYQVFVRACVKSEPPAFWPQDSSKGFFVFEDDKLDAVKNAMIIEALGIRAARKSGMVPWQIPGDQCHRYGRDCEHLAGGCRKYDFPVPPKLDWHPTDPGFAAARALGLDPNDPELVVLSQSGYQTSTRCLEKFRREYGGEGQGEESFELEVGTAYHAAVAEINRQISLDK
jgi:hypothetical protein